MSITMPHLNGHSIYQNQNGINLTPAAAGQGMPMSKEPLPANETLPNPEVQQRAQRRTFTRQYKDDILKQVQNCKEHGQIGALLRREGLYSSHLTDWKRKQVQANQQAKKGGKAIKALPGSSALADNAKAQLPLAQQNRELRRKTTQLERQLAQAQALLDLQKKVSQLLGITLETPEDDS